MQFLGVDFTESFSKIASDTSTMILIKLLKLYYADSGCSAELFLVMVDKRHCLSVNRICTKNRDHHTSLSFACLVFRSFMFGRGKLSKVLLYRVFRDVVISFEATRARALAQDKLRRKEREAAEATAEGQRATSERDDRITEHLERPASRPCYMESGRDTAPLFATSTATATAMFTATSTTPGIATAVTITASSAPLREGTTHRRISYPTLTPWSASAVLVITVFKLIRLKGGCDLFILNLVFIWLDSLVFVFNSSRLTFQRIYFRPKSYSSNHIFSQALRSHTLIRVSFEIFQHWNRGIFHNSENWIWVWQKTF